MIFKAITSYAITLMFVFPMNCLSFERDISASKIHADIYIVSLDTLTVVSLSPDAVRSGYRTRFEIRDVDLANSYLKNVKKVKCDKILVSPLSDIRIVVDFYDGEREIKSYYMNASALVDADHPVVGCDPKAFLQKTMKLFGDAMGKIDAP